MIFFVFQTMCVRMQMCSETETHVLTFPSQGLCAHFLILCSAQMKCASMWPKHDLTFNVFKIGFNTEIEMVGTGWQNRILHRFFLFFEKKQKLKVA